MLTLFIAVVHFCPKGWGEVHNGQVSCLPKEVSSSVAWGHEGLVIWLFNGGGCALVRGARPPIDVPGSVRGAVPERSMGEVRLPVAAPGWVAEDPCSRLTMPTGEDRLSAPGVDGWCTLDGTGPLADRGGTAQDCRSWASRMSSEYPETAGSGARLVLARPVERNEEDALVGAGLVAEEWEALGVDLPELAAEFRAELDPVRPAEES